MATIALYSTWANQMPVQIQETRLTVVDYQDKLFSLKSQVLTIDSRICDMEDVIGSLQATVQIQEEKISSLDILYKNNEEFLLNVIGIDEEVGALITQRKEEFYALYGYLKPECEKTWMEKAGDWFASVGEWCKDQWDKALLYTTYLMSLEALLLPAVSLFVEGFTVSALKNVMEMPMVFWYPSLILDELLLDGQAGISKFLNSYDNRVENLLMWNRGYVKNVPIFNLGRCAADIVSIIVGIAGLQAGAYMAFLGTTGGTAGTAVGGGAIAIPVGAVAVDVGVLVAAASVPLLVQGAANFKKDKDEYWKSRLNESRSSGSSGSGTEGGSNPTTGSGFKWGNPKSTPTYGHTFSQHGQKLTLQQLIDRANGFENPHQVGQWLNDKQAADFLADAVQNRGGSFDIPLPSDINARVVLPDGTTITPDMARIIMRPDGSIRTAYPFSSLFPTN